LTIRVEAVPLPADVPARSHVNTTSDHHVIQLSDALPLVDVDEFLAQELRVLSEMRRRPVAGSRAPSTHLLTPGLLSAETVPRLSAEDHGILARLDHLAGPAN